MLNSLQRIRLTNSVDKGIYVYGIAIAIITKIVCDLMDV